MISNKLGENKAVKERMDNGNEDVDEPADPDDTTKSFKTSITTTSDGKSPIKRIRSCHEMEI